LTSSVPLDGIVLNTVTGFDASGGGVSDSDGVSIESELSLDVRFGGPSLVSLPLRG
jgi:hypothetical protein